jgi:hypothetical protein
MQPLRRPAVAAVLLGIALAQTGCYEWVAVRPDQAMALTQPENAPERPESTEPPAETVAERPGGRNVQLSDSSDIRVTLKSGEVRTFLHPVRIASEGEGETLVFDSPALEPVRVPRDQIVALEALGYNRRMTTVAIVTAGVVTAAAIATLIVVVLANNGNVDNTTTYNGNP